MASDNFTDSPASAGNRGQLIDSQQWKCCNCDHGFWSDKTDLVCPNCNVPRCTRCGVC
ncbi:hypothetical protein FPSE_08878 [Fusarium pseudograminearum CS3096]|uniref:Uncharacterized protein n=1 Tax=Fusarium pseudograminearum (strain CS3096) TaxID=1028729 RepID=K3VYM5_FUSPC|nr:hypothetical protein FPSE_08878 [Fusarium pseudograminearum CS3096]EKJ70910.1 hypothetical protein FPSE_08878 [Fusarium pseudograminearum CS3096]